jgi:hypothetical protein
MALFLSKIFFSHHWVSQKMQEEAYAAAGETEKTDHAAVTALGLETAATATTS